MHCARYGAALRMSALWDAPRCAQAARFPPLQVPDAPMRTGLRHTARLAIQSWHRGPNDVPSVDQTDQVAGEVVLEGRGHGQRLPHHDAKRIDVHLRSKDGRMGGADSGNQHTGQDLPSGQCGASRPVPGRPQCSEAWWHCRPLTLDDMVSGALTTSGAVHGSTPWLLGMGACAPTWLCRDMP